jgi:ribonuclease J
MQPNHKDFWFVPLGGCGEIGMNLNLYGHAGSWLMVDCGVTFEKRPDGAGVGNRIELPDPSFISNRAESLVALIATHAHEDHIGAIAHLWEQFQCPIYTTRFTRNVLLRKLREKGLDAPIITVSAGEEIQLGPFQVRWLPITHSTPETHGLLICTPVGKVLHTADWKIDSAPIAGEPVRPPLYQALGRSGLDAIVCDSTNAAKPGHSVSESELFTGLNRIVAESPQRVVVGCFSSNVARLQTLGNVSQVTGRYLGLLGRSLHRMVASARASGYLEENFTVVDHVIFSTMTIPGNEKQVNALVAAFRARGITVTLADESDIPLHASGHPCAAELAQMYQWTRPHLAIPVHGEDMHMRANARLASEQGVPHQLVGKNGDLFDLIAKKKQEAAVKVGRLWLNESSLSLEPVTQG